MLSFELKIAEALCLANSQLWSNYLVLVVSSLGTSVTENREGCSMSISMQPQCFCVTLLKAIPLKAPSALPASAV
jgi:hypothetical protein